MSKKRIILLAVLVIFLVGGFVINAKLKDIERNLNEARANDVDLSQVADGTYRGSYSVFPVSVDVEVTVEKHAIVEIELVEHNHGQGEDAEVIPGLVIEAQSLEVDVISGATYSSNIILKAIEVALTD